MERSRDIDSRKEKGETKDTKSVVDAALPKLLESYSFGITYSALQAEVSPEELIFIGPKVDLYTIAPRAELDPSEEAASALRLANERSGFILIPGRQFDTLGTRHGRGGGWYDRFLSYVPASWLRIGFCFADQFVKTLLVREPWDQPVDYTCVVEKNSSGIMATLHKTDARAHDVFIN